MALQLPDPLRVLADAIGQEGDVVSMGGSLHGKMEVLALLGTNPAVEPNLYQISPDALTGLTVNSGAASDAFGAYQEIWSAAGSPGKAAILGFWLSGGVSDHVVVQFGVGGVGAEVPLMRLKTYAFGFGAGTTGPGAFSPVGSALAAGQRLAVSIARRGAGAQAYALHAIYVVRP